MTAPSWAEWKAETIATHRTKPCTECRPLPDCDNCGEQIVGVPVTFAEDDFWMRQPYRRKFCTTDCHQNYAERQMTP